jgi:ABC-type siderophore export system fused ATPase/permease subunit
MAGLTMKLNGQSDSHAGPSLLGLAIVYTLLVGARVISALLLKHGALVINPYSSAEEPRRFFADNPIALRVAEGSVRFLLGRTRTGKQIVAQLLVGR